MLATIHDVLRPPSPLERSGKGEGGAEEIVYSCQQYKNKIGRPQPPSEGLITFVLQICIST